MSTEENTQKYADHHEIEEGKEFLLDFDKLRSAAQSERGLVPAVAQDVETGAVLIVGYADKEALDYSIDHGVATFYSTSRKQLWVKGATSGDYLDIVEIRVNCEQNSLLYLVRLRKEGSCHTKDKNGKSRYGCYYRKVVKVNDTLRLSPVDPSNIHADQ
jgi:phosphoribosyl-AMP cyclohydrolase